jgi:protein TonB
LFGVLPVSPGGRRAFLGASAAAHAAALATLVLVPLLSREALPPAPDYVRARIHAPPAAAPPPPPAGSPTGATAATRRAAPTVQPATIMPLPQEALPTDTPAPFPPAEQRVEVWGSPAGSPAGNPDGIEGGVRDGQVGGVPGGSPDGVVGGDGDVPVPVRDYDRPPRPLTQTRPVYPPEAFQKKIEGTVLTEILIGVDGHVVRARIVRSVPALDAAALAAVRQWTFAPGMKSGRPVATLATAPVTFRIY